MIKLLFWYFFNCSSYRQSRILLIWLYLSMKWLVSSLFIYYIHLVEMKENEWIVFSNICKNTLQVTHFCNNLIQFFRAFFKMIAYCESIIKYHSHPADTSYKLNVYKTFRRRQGRLLKVLSTFNLRLVSAGWEWYLIIDIMWVYN